MTGTDGALRITISPAGLHLRGEIDAHSASVLAKHLDPLPGSEGDVLLDLSGVGFVDSSGLRVLVEAHQRAEADARRLVLSGSSRPVLRLLEISGLLEYLHVQSPPLADEAEGSGSDNGGSNQG